MIGTRLGPYEILAKVGEGRMGTVYRAHDSRLGRDVEREARAIAALNHAQRPVVAAARGHGRSHFAILVSR